MNRKKTSKKSEDKAASKCRVSSAKPRTPTCKRFKWCKDDMDAALKAFAEGMSQRQACDKFGVPRSTLQKILAGKTYIGAKPGKKPLFGSEQNCQIMLQIEQHLVSVSAKSSS